MHYYLLVLFAESAVVDYCVALWRSVRRKRPARMVPLMLCQAQEMAQGSTERGWAAKKVPARTVASPAFCMPTSMLMVRFLAVLKRARRPAV